MGNNDEDFSQIFIKRGVIYLLRVFYFIIWSYANVIKTRIQN